MVLLYTTGCPRCKVLEFKLKQKNIKYEEVTDVEKMKSLGILSVPMLYIENKLLEFTDAIKYVNNI